MAIFAIAAIQQEIASVDITGAYLECMLSPEDEMHMELDPTVLDA